MTYYFGVDVVFRILGRSKVENKFCSSQEENMNMYVGVMLSSYDWLKNEEPSFTRDGKSLLS